jgi:hypothetical protein
MTPEELFIPPGQETLGTGVEQAQRRASMKTLSTTKQAIGELYAFAIALDRSGKTLTAAQLIHVCDLALIHVTIPTGGHSEPDSP